MKLFDGMELETENSKYKVTTNHNQRKFVVKKKEAKNERSSGVTKGQELIGNKLVLTSSGNVELYEEGRLILRTSPLIQDQ